MKKVKDPEIGIDIWTLGLVYDIKIEKKLATITMTLTSTMCPYGPMLMDDAKRAVEDIGLKATIDLTFEPPWEPSAELRAMLGI